LDIWELIKAGDVNEAEVLMDKFVADFNQHPYSGAALGRVAINCYMTAEELKKQDQREQAKEYFALAEDIWQRVITNNLPGNTGGAYYYVASCRQQLGKWEDAINYYQKVVDDWPGFEYVCGAQAAVGWCYEALRDSGKIPKEQANPIIEQAYAAVLTNFSDCYVADYVTLRLARINLDKGDKVAAAAYYGKFLELVHPEDKRIPVIKGILAELEGTNK
jgi:tetratricopeptide (TPR) repeat protein